MHVLMGLFFLMHYQIVTMLFDVAVECLCYYMVCNEYCYVTCAVNRKNNLYDQLSLSASLKYMNIRPDIRKHKNCVSVHL